MSHKTPTIYIDMDGVLCDMEHTYVQMFNMTPFEARQKGKDVYDENWNKFIYARAFRRLPWMPGADKLIEFFRSVEGKVNLAILSSSSGLESHFIVQHDKLIWLEDHDVKYPALIVPGRKYKASYAKSTTFLIDDHIENCTDFRAAGGSSVAHHDADESIRIMREWVNVQTANSVTIDKPDWIPQNV